MMAKTAFETNEEAGRIYTKCKNKCYLDAYKEG
jgi:hypothetical protein